MCYSDFRSECAGDWYLIKLILDRVHDHMSVLWIELTGVWEVPISISCNEVRACCFARFVLDLPFPLLIVKKVFLKLFSL